MDDTRRMFDLIKPIIDEELRVAFAMGHFGPIEMPSPDRIEGVASLIADEVARYLTRPPS